MPRTHKGEKLQLYTKQVRGAWTQTLTVGVRTHQSLQSKARGPPSRQDPPKILPQAIRCPQTLSQPSLPFCHTSSLVQGHCSIWCS